ncbi:ammonia-forming cytochrome c nitrite reductase subunit c552 [Sunxiuqinia sp. A32]|uniref:ammonia-forming cytochrome c nitrite reductase subunit c552 n=1 Tax=Sunxiuqinia sp. A32 TaxID=3461496 RepID=UPI00404570DC
MKTNKSIFYILLLAFPTLVGIAISCQTNNKADKQELASAEYAGSVSCRECHERFYKLWEPSYHGKAMEPINAAFIEKNKLPDSELIPVESSHYQVVFEDTTMVLYEKEDDKILNSYQVAWSMGGHNVYCFLTPLEKGKLQTIPLAYDMNRKTWFNYPESAVRHFYDEEIEDEALPWKDAMYTFNTGCYSCHISQLSTNFDLGTETYHTTWREAGINCETCHGPAEEHIRIFKNLKEGEEPEDVGLIVTKKFTQEQHNASCAPCHAKMTPITPSYTPGNKYFDNYDVATLEDRDFYPDGRSLGENYTLTSWMMNPCVPKSKLHCVTCHTSSGRDRNKDNPNNSCISCHADKGENFEAHTGHKPEAKLTCISCHMPRREFVGHFMRSDHSFRPPMPELTIRFGSPNACNQCHSDKSPEWANKIVKKRPNGNYQEETLQWAQLIKEARDNNWENVDLMFKYIGDEKTNEVIRTSLIRLMVNYPETSKLKIFIKALQSKSELVRSAAASGLSGYHTLETKKALLKACEDEIRLVRINAVSSLLSYTTASFTKEEQTIIDKAEQEYVISMTARPDNWSAHYNLGIYHQNKGNTTKAINSYETAVRLYPQSLMPLINSSILYSYKGNTAKAAENLRLAIQYDPDNEAANLNYGLLMAEMQKMDDAEKALRTVLKTNKENATAAYNLSVIVSQKDLNEACEFSKIAMEAEPQDPKFAYTHAYFLNQNKQQEKAIEILDSTIQKNPDHLASIFLLGNIYLESGNKGKTLQLYENSLKNIGNNQQATFQLQQAIAQIKQM